MSETSFPCILQAGDSALLVAFGDVLTMDINNAAHAFDAAVNDAAWQGVQETTPGIRGVLVRYDPLVVKPDLLKNRLQEKLDEQDWLSAEPVSGRRRWLLPACYGGDGGPDLNNVASELGLAVDDVIRQHSECRVRVLMLGFSPGCAYLGSLPENWDLPRLDHVKPEVPPGSLSVAVRQTVMFATPIPTGWQTIARTPFLSFSRNKEPYFQLAAGDEVTFQPINQQTFDELAEEVKQGKQIVAAEPVS